MKLPALSAKDKAIVILSVFVFGGYGLYTVIDSIIGFCRTEPEIFNGIVRIVWALLFIALGLVNTMTVFRKADKRKSF